MTQVKLEYKLTAEQQKAVIGVLAVIGLVAVYGWAIRPHVALLRAAQQYEWATSQCLDLGGSIGEDILAEREKLHALDAERTTFSEMAFSPAEAVKFQNDLQALCRETGCRVAVLVCDSDETVARQATQGAISAVVVSSVELTVHGTYGSVVRLLETLLSRRQEVWIDSFNVTAPSSKPDRLVCEMTITICVDYAKGKDTP